MKIYGAGLAGLLAGCHFQRATIYEAQPQHQPHKALLRFRSSAVGDAVGIEFRKVRVHKAIWPPEKPSIRRANQYSQKVVGVLADRSIWDLEPVDRYIAPGDFIEQLLERCAGRIVWEHAISANDLVPYGENTISTLPMSMVHQWVCTYRRTHVESISDEVNFAFKHIHVRRYKIAGADVFQTVYFPLPSTTLYRASITGDTLIAEYIGEPDGYDFFTAFGINQDDCAELETTNNKTDRKIRTINNEWRKEFIYDLTTRFNIYSLGRYATWRNILLDDVVHDITVLKKMMKAGAYDRAKMNTN